MTNHDDYFALPGINATAIKQGRKSMLAMRHAMTTGTDDCKMLRMGRLAHTAILEPHKLDQVEIIDADSWQSKAAQAALREADGNAALPSEMATVKAMRDAVLGNRFATDLIADTDHEVTLQWYDPIYKQAKARMDGINRYAMLEVKTTGAALDDRSLTRLSWNLGYHVQAGWYATGAVECGLVSRVPDAYILWVESDPPHDMRVTRMEHGLVETGAAEAIRIARDYRACEACGVFPGVCGEVTVLDAPAWAKGEWIVDDNKEDT